MKQCKKRAVVIAGMHRSGTSLIAKAVHALGVNLGDNFLPPSDFNLRGFWENRQIMELNERILFCLGVDWKSLAYPSNIDFTTPRFALLREDASDIIRSMAADSQLIGFKDPRISRLLPFWQKVLSDLDYRVQYVIAHRNPLDICLSLERRDRLTLSYSVILWLQHVHTIAAALQAFKTLVVKYENILDDPMREIERLASYLSFEANPNDEQRIEFKNEFVDKSLQNFTSTNQEVKHFFKGRRIISWTFEQLEKFAASTHTVGSEWKKINRKLEHLDLVWDAAQYATLGYNLDYYYEDADLPEPELLIDLGDGFENGSLLRPDQHQEGVYIFKIEAGESVEKLRLFPSCGVCALRFISSRYTADNIEVPVNVSDTNASMTDAQNIYIFETSAPYIEFDIDAVITKFKISFAVIARDESIRREKEALLTRTLRALDHKSQQIENLYGRIEEVEKQKLHVKSELKNKEHKARIIEQALNDREVKIAELNTKFDELDIVATKVHKKSEALSKEIDAAQQTIETKESELKELSTQNEELSKALNAAQQTIETKESELKELSTQNEELSKALNAAQQTIEAKEKGLKELNKRDRFSRLQVFEVSHQLNLLHQSSSWKITAPLRALKSLLTGKWKLAILYLKGYPANTPFAENANKAPLVYNASQIVNVNESSVSTRANDKLSAQEAPATGDSSIVTTLPSGNNIRASWEAEDAEPVSISPGTHFDVLYVIGCLEGESKRYRVHNMLTALRVVGWTVAATVEIEIDWLIENNVTATRIVFFRLAWSPFAQRFIKYAQNIGAYTYFDVDDLIFEPESIGLVRAIDHYSYIERLNYKHDVERYRTTLEACDAVITTTSYLANRISSIGKESHIAPNTINQKQIEIAQSLLKPKDGTNKTIRIGYFSGTATHQQDFLQCESALLNLLQKHSNTIFVLVGYLELSDSWNEFADRIEKYDFLPYIEMLEVLGTIDINLAPLEIGNPYCEGKSQLKIFEAGLLNIPTVASETASFKQAIKNGEDGFLATSEQDWIKAFEVLLISAQTRREMGEKARSRALDQFGPKRLSDTLLQIFGKAFVNAPKLNYMLCKEKTTKSVQTKGKIGWIIPPLLKGSGGHRTIFQHVEALAKEGYECHCYIAPGNFKTCKKLAKEVADEFHCTSCFIHQGFTITEKIDLLFATSWDTVATVVNSDAHIKAYFIQDYEPLFFPMCDSFLEAESTYNYGLKGITIGRWLTAKLYKEHGIRTQYFDFCFDTNVYKKLVDVERENAVCFIHQPEKQRRCALLGLKALSILKEIRPSTTIYLYGSNEVIHPIPFDHVNLNLITPEECNKLYQACKVGLCISSTNPSRIPFEMMASGLPVVEIYRENNLYDIPDGVGLLANPDSESIAKAIMTLLNDDDRRKSMSNFGMEFMHERQIEYGLQQFISAVEALLSNEVVIAADVDVIYSRPPVVADYIQPDS